MSYSEYNAAGFAADHFFIQWVKKPTAANEQFWVNWLEKNPEQQEVIQEARDLVEMLSVDEDAMQDWELEEVWQKLRVARNNQELTETRRARVLPLRFWQRKETGVAAVASLFLLVAGIFLFQSADTPPIEYTTRYGEKRTIQLPDSSVVVLNAHSKLTIPAGWTADKPREVKLNGEAFFSVSHQINHRKFIVHTSDGIQVEVTGTTFNVSDRGPVSRVVLTSGKVQLHIAAAGQHKQVVMRPGELVEVPDQAGSFTRRKVNTELYTSWKENKLVFHNTSLGEIATMLEQTYGYTVIFRDPALANQKITAFLDAGSLNDILLTLSETFGLKMTRQHQKIILISNY